MICDECGREHLHDAGKFRVVDVQELSTGYKATVRGTDIVAFAVTTEHLEMKVHHATDGLSLHWHWPGSTLAEQERIQQRIFRGELEATDADGVETMGGQQ